MGSINQFPILQAEGYIKTATALATAARNLSDLGDASEARAVLAHAERAYEQAAAVSAEWPDPLIDQAVAAEQAIERANAAIAAAPQR